MGPTSPGGTVICVSSYNVFVSWIHPFRSEREISEIFHSSFINSRKWKPPTSSNPGGCCTAYETSVGSCRKITLYL